VPGDEIVGYSARGTGVSIHRKDCPNVKSFEPERILPVSWQNVDASVFVAKLRIECIDKPGLITEISGILAQNNCNITAFETRINRERGTANISMGVQIKNKEEIEYIIKKLEGSRSVLSIKREN
jgi:GTP pyrophosphokinase